MRATARHPREGDLAFADTVVAVDLERALSHRHPGWPPPASGPPPCVPAPPTTPRSTTRELVALWASTASADGDRSGVFVRAGRVGWRIRTLLAHLEWDRRDGERALWLGFAMFVFASMAAVMLLDLAG